MGFMVPYMKSLRRHKTAIFQLEIIQTWMRKFSPWVSHWLLKLYLNSSFCYFMIHKSFFHNQTSIFSVQVKRLSQFWRAQLILNFAQLGFQREDNLQVLQLQIWGFLSNLINFLWLCCSLPTLKYMYSHNSVVFISAPILSRASNLYSLVQEPAWVLPKDICKNLLILLL